MTLKLQKFSWGAPPPQTPQKSPYNFFQNHWFEIFVNIVNVCEINNLLSDLVNVFKIDNLVTDLVNIFQSENLPQT